jgi:hypothetical protein
MKTSSVWYLGLRAEKTAVSGYGSDFLAGLDPFGVWTARYGREAEHAGLSEREHALKRGLGTAGGLVGGSLLVPSAIFGITGAAKGFGTTQGGLGKRLSGALSGGIEGFKKPVKSVGEGFRSLGAMKRLAREGGTLQPREVEALNYLARQVPLGSIEESVSPFMKRLEEAGFGRDRLAQMIQRGARPEDFRQFGPEVERYVRMVHSGMSPEDMRASAGHVARAAAGLPNSGGGLASAAMDAASRGVYPEHAREVARAAGAEELGEDAARVVGRMRTGLGDEDIKQLAGAAVKPTRSALYSGLAQLGIGGGIGAGGAYMQYGQGRKTERETNIPSRIKRRLGFGGDR